MKDTADKEMDNDRDIIQMENKEKKNRSKDISRVC